MSNGRSSGHAANDRAADRWTEAEAVFAAWLGLREGPAEARGGADFERLCRGHPAIAAELRRLLRGLVHYGDLRDRTLGLLSSRRVAVMHAHAARR